jgi:hypothetical protein
MRRSTITHVAAFVAVMLLAAGTRAQQDITGVWTVSLEVADSKVEVLATVKQAGEKLQLTLAGPTGNFELAGTLIEDQLSVNYTMDVQGTPAEIKMTGTVGDGRITGTIDFLGRGTLKWTAVRKRDVPASDAAAGEAVQPATPEAVPAPAADSVPAPSTEEQPRQR